MYFESSSIELYCDNAKSYLMKSNIHGLHSIDYVRHNSTCYSKSTFTICVETFRSRKNCNRQLFAKPLKLVLFLNILTLFIWTFLLRVNDVDLNYIIRLLMTFVLRLINCCFY